LLIDYYEKPRTLSAKRKREMQEHPPLIPLLKKRERFGSLREVSDGVYPSQKSGRVIQKKGWGFSVFWRKKMLGE
jgi:hypothetical protein